MKNLVIHRSTFIFLTFFILVFSNFSHAQSAEALLRGLDQDSLKSLAESSSSMAGDSMSDDTKELGSIAESDYLKTIQQIKKIDYKVQQKNINNALHEKRIELAIKLCQVDKSACYLIDEYQDYKELIDIQPLEVKDLNVFGVDMFSGYPLSFEQSIQSSVPEDYLINIGDNINIAIFGSDSFESTFTIQRDGNLIIPEHGAINILGLTLNEARIKISDFLKNKYIETEVYVSIESTNTLQIYVLGAIKNPGSYNLSSISKPINAVIATGGFSPESSLRNLKIIRDGKNINSVDLYKLLINGKTNQDSYLQDGDTIMVGARQNTVTIWGDINRPAIYEFKQGETFQDLIQFGLGFKQSANLDNISLQRRNNFGQIETISVKSNQVLELKNGDTFKVHSLEGETLNSILLTGAIRNSGEYQYKDGMILSDIFKLQTDLVNDTYVGLGILKRFNAVTRTYNIEEFNLLDQSRLNEIKLKAGDKLYFFSQDDISFINSKQVLDYLQNNLGIDPVDSQKILADSSKSLLTQANSSFPYEGNSNSLENCFTYLKQFGGDDFIQSSTAKLELFNTESEQECPEILNQNPDLTPVLLNASVPVNGAIRYPGLYPIDNDVDVSLLLEMVGGIISNTESKVVIEIMTQNGEINDYIPGSKDLITSIKFFNAKAGSKIRKESFIKLVGEFKSPGVYPLSSQTTLLDLYERAGGLTSNAYPVGGILTRKTVLELEKDSLKKAERELADILASGVTSGQIEQKTSDVLALITLMNEISAATPTGRLVTSLEPSEIKKDLTKNILLEPGDVIYMPKMLSTVTVVGSVLNPVTVPYSPRLNVNDYVKLAGGYKDYADSSKTYVILPNGMSTSPSFSIFNRPGSQILPGSSIIVPRKARPLSGLALVEAISPVLANLSITMASINSITTSN